MKKKEGLWLSKLYAPYKSNMYKNGEHTWISLSKQAWRRSVSRHRLE